MSGSKSTAREWCVCANSLSKMSPQRKTCINSEAPIDGKRKGEVCVCLGRGEQSVTGNEGGREEAARSHRRGENKSRCGDYKDCTTDCSYQRAAAFPFSPLLVRGYINQSRRCKSLASAVRFCGQSESPSRVDTNTPDGFFYCFLVFSSPCR